MHKKLLFTNQPAQQYQDLIVHVSGSKGLQPQNELKSSDQVCQQKPLNIVQQAQCS